MSAFGTKQTFGKSIAYQLCYVTVVIAANLTEQTQLQTLSIKNNGWKKIKKKKKKNLDLQFRNQYSGQCVNCNDLHLLFA